MLAKVACLSKFCWKKMSNIDHVKKIPKRREKITDE